MATRVCNTAAAWRQFDGITADGAQQTRDAYRMMSAGTLNTERQAPDLRRLPAGSTAVFNSAFLSVERAPQSAIG